MARSTLDRVSGRMKRTDGIEIERVWLCREMAALPRDTEHMEFEQGYIAQGREAEAGLVGRVRRVTHSDGRVEYWNTIKRGVGQVREEIEEQIDADRFNTAWPTTSGARVHKTRWFVPCDRGLVWEVDQFLDLPIVLAEIELPTIDTEVELPSWLVDVMVKEVTDDSRYTNSSLARWGVPRR